MSISGPQAERLSNWSKEGDLGYPSERDDIRGPKFAGKEQAYQDELKRLRGQMEFMKQVIMRQEVELNRFEMRAPVASGQTQMRRTLRQILPSCLLTPDPSHGGSSLLRAYDDGIAGLENAKNPWRSMCGFSRAMRMSLLQRTSA